jgi:sulfofructose kinase
MVGVSCLDHLWQIEEFPPKESRTHASDYRMQGGGPAATAAAAAARLGAQVELWAIHGADENGKIARAELESFGVDCSRLRELPGAHTIVSGILVAPGGERYIFPYMGAGLLDSAEGLKLARVAQVDCVLFDARHPIMAQAVLEEARRLEKPIVADFSNTQHWHLSQYADYLIVSEECATQLLGRNDPEAALEKLKQVEDQLVGITLGEEGFLYEQQGRLRHIPALAVKAVDTTGAGDVFHGAYAYGVASGWDVDRCGLFASVTAALKCTALGGRSAIPYLKDVEELLLEQSAREMDN